jgi:hypothetical protein
MTHSRSQVRAAGQTLRTWWRARLPARWISPELEIALNVLDAYRAAHQRPLTTVTMGLRSMVATVQKTIQRLSFLPKEPPRGVVSQRLNRHFSIIRKLADEPTMQLTTMQDIAVGDPSPPPASGRWSWPDLLRHTFAVDVLACPRCGGRTRVVATIEDPVVIRKILTHLGLPTDVPAPRPPPADLFGWS